MIPRADYLWITARECSASAAEVDDPELKKLFGAFATLWRALAQHIESMEQDEPGRRVVAFRRARRDPSV